MMYERYQKSRKISMSTQCNVLVSTTSISIDVAHKTSKSKVTLHNILRRIIFKLRMSIEIQSTLYCSVVLSKDKDKFSF